MEALFRRLTYYADIGDEEFRVLSKLRGHNESYSSGQDLIRRGDCALEAFVILKGWAVRYITLEDGRAQVLNFMLPGDIFDLQVMIADGADHSISALNAVTAYHVSRTEILNLFTSGTRAGAALWWCALQEEAILREQIVRNGRRSARERLAHLLLELHRRALVAGEGEGETFNLPVSQAILADALGLSFVHVNRVLREFLKTDCIARRGKEIQLLDRGRLVEIAGFSDDYLHLDISPRRLSFTANRIAS